MSPTSYQAAPPRIKNNNQLSCLDEPDMGLLPRGYGGVNS